MRFRKGLDKNTGSAHFRSQRMHQNTGFCIKYTKKIRGSRPPDPRGGREDNFVRTYPRGPPNDGAPPLLLGWLRPCLVLCQTLIFVQPYSLWNDTITGYNGAYAKVNVVFTARRHALQRGLC